ncbi:Amidase 1 [Cyphellophora attinorum]|uniref:Amidase 1 n=1 Tax=Cyphellophora attinorum TaxID=1664694 RepID=A0A0N0NMU2_9EURO|nr:Amidase 1 [Phialophora attinorum]KPI40609.1 Amidase 1 [Phialophora attinorum]
MSYFSVGGPIDWPDFSTMMESSDIDLPAGAYVALPIGNTVSIAKAYQIQEDPAIAFMSGAKPVPGGDGMTFVEYSGGNIPVPPAVGEGPLAGMRFAVKDIYHVKGLTTSGGSRSFYDTYGPQNFTNEVVETCLAAGAQLVGKTKTIAFALGTPLNGWQVDYQDPWSFRGDGYQTTGGSSSGSSAAIVAYDWLDFTIGSDTGGSVRYPARHAGFYGYKATHGMYNLTGILPAIAEQDTPGTWRGHQKSSPQSAASGSTYWADEPALTQPEAEAMKLEFFTKVETLLQAKTTTVNLTSSFRANVINETFQSYYFYVYQDQNSAQSWDLIGKPLAEAYGAANDGAFPPLDPAVNLTADGVNATTRARYNESVHRREQYAEWFNTYILPTDPETCTSAIVAHSLHVPPSTVKVDQTKVHLVEGYGSGLEASFAGFPEIVVPIGQIEYHSHFTRKMEWQPVTVAFAAAVGSTDAADATEGTTDAADTTDATDTVAFTEDTEAVTAGAETAEAATLAWTLTEAVGTETTEIAEVAAVATVAWAPTAAVAPETTDATGTVTFAEDAESVTPSTLTAEAVAVTWALTEAVGAETTEAMETTAAEAVAPAGVATEIVAVPTLPRTPACTDDDCVAIVAPTLAWTNDDAEPNADTATSGAAADVVLTRVSNVVGCKVAATAAFDSDKLANEALASDALARDALACAAAETLAADILAAAARLADALAESWLAEATLATEARLTEYALAEALAATLRTEALDAAATASKEALNAEAEAAEALAKFALLIDALAASSAALAAAILAEIEALIAAAEAEEALALSDKAASSDALTSAVGSTAAEVIVDAVAIAVLILSPVTPARLVAMGTAVTVGLTKMDAETVAPAAPKREIDADDSDSTEAGTVCVINVVGTDAASETVIGDEAASETEMGDKEAVPNTVGTEAPTEAVAPRPEEAWTEAETSTPTPVGTTWTLVEAVRRDEDASTPTPRVTVGLTGKPDAAAEIAMLAPDVPWTEADRSIPAEDAGTIVLAVGLTVEPASSVTLTGTLEAPIPSPMPRSELAAAEAETSTPGLVTDTSTVVAGLADRAAVIVALSGRPESPADTVASIPEVAAAVAETSIPAPAPSVEGTADVSVCTIDADNDSASKELRAPDRTDTAPPEAAVEVAVAPTSTPEIVSEATTPMLAERSWEVCKALIADTTDDRSAEMIVDTGRASGELSTLDTADMGSAVTPTVAVAPTGKPEAPAETPRPIVEDRSAETETSTPGTLVGTTDTTGLTSAVVVSTGGLEAATEMATPSAEDTSVETETSTPGTLVGKIDRVGSTDTPAVIVGLTRRPEAPTETSTPTVEESCAEAETSIPLEAVMEGTSDVRD